MDPTVLINLGLGLLNQVLGFIAEIKSQSGATDDAILAQAQKITAGNDAAYAQLVAVLQSSGTTSTTTKPKV